MPLFLEANLASSTNHCHLCAWDATPSSPCSGRLLRRTPFLRCRGYRRVVLIGVGLGSLRHLDRRAAQFAARSAVLWSRCPHRDGGTVPNIQPPHKPSCVAVGSVHPYFAICTKSLFATLAGTACGSKCCGDRQLSKIPTCCTQLTVHFGAHPVCV